MAEHSKDNIRDMLLFCCRSKTLSHYEHIEKNVNSFGGLFDGWATVFLGSLSLNLGIRHVIWAICSTCPSICIDTSHEDIYVNQTYSVDGLWVSADCCISSVCNKHKNYGKEIIVGCKIQLILNPHLSFVMCFIWNVWLCVHIWSRSFIY